MAAEARPDRPTPDADSEAWWAALQDGTLMLNSCRSCSRASLYVRPFCPHCWSEDVELVPASGQARLYTWSTVHAASGPYVVAMVDLAEGPRIMTVIEGIPEPQPDMELQLAFRTGDDGFNVPVFRPR
jgi:uncharacterized protein